MSLSRFDADFFTKNFHYTTGFWQEHDENFKQLIEKVISDENIVKLVESACFMTFQFNSKSGWINSEHNQYISDVFQGLVEHVKKDKKVVYDLASAYFAIFVKKKESFDPKEILTRKIDDISQSAELVKLKSLFKDNEDIYTDSDELVKLMRSFAKDYNKKICIESLFPCLMLFFLRIFDIYDSATQGLPVDVLLQKIENSKKPKEHTDEREALKSVLGEKLLSQFGQKNFWKARYNNITSDSKPYDWYASWNSIKERVCEKTNITKLDHPIEILDVGCGNSSLPLDLLQDEDLNIKHITCIDFVQDVIDVQSEIAEIRNIQDKVKYECTDAVDLSKYGEEKFDFIIDKGCLDSILSTKNADESFFQACKSVSKVLKTGGYFVIVSCALSYERLLPFKRLHDFRWRILHLSELPSDSNKDVKIYLIIIKKLNDEEIEEEVKKASNQ